MMSAGESDAGGGRAWTFGWEAPVHAVFPALHAAQNAWLAEIDDLHAPDHKTRELIRLVCNVALRSAAGVERHARLAGELGASWDEVLGAILLTAPTFGMVPAVEMLGAARQGYDRHADAAAEDETDDIDDIDSEIDDEEIVHDGG
jgi:alkylhydroperoxidase/carboxymuconolactone decarboxylase family protein YurZ